MMALARGTRAHAREEAAVAIHEAMRGGSSNADAIAAVVATVEDYFLGWYDGDAERGFR